MTGIVRIFVIDDHPVVRDGVELLAQTSPRLRIVGYAPTGHDALATIAEAKPNVVLLDLRLPDMLAPELIVELRRAVPQAKIIIFTAYPDHPAVNAALEAGADGILPKDTARMDLIATIKRVLTLECEKPHSSGGRSLLRDAQPPIARREYDILRRVARGETNQEIAEAMTLSHNTVKSYLRNLMHKLRARNRVEAVRRALEMGLL